MQIGRQSCSYVFTPKNLLGKLETFKCACFSTATLKNALKASLIDMENTHGDKWRRALPWVLLGKRIAFQPDLNTSAALLAFGRSPLIPGQVIGEPGPPLTSLQVRALLEELYRMEAKPALQTSSNKNEIDISSTEAATHVYVKVEEPKGLSARFEGPYEIVSRPSRSQVQVRIGSYVSGEPRLSTYHWSSCKIAYMRDNALEGARPKLGRPSVQNLDSAKSPDPPPPSSSASPNKLTDAQNNKQPVVVNGAKSQIPVPQQQTSDGAKIQNALRPVRATRNPHPRYVNAIAA